MKTYFEIFLRWRWFESLPLAIGMLKWILKIAFQKNSIKEPKTFLPHDDIWLQPANQRNSIQTH
jgi:hypothetical protein